jgi:hypothetical protein
VRTTNPSEPEVVEYLTYLHSSGTSFSVINTHKSAILQTMQLCNDNSWCLKSVLLTRFMKGLSNLQPPRPRYTRTWDVQEVLVYLSSLCPVGGLSLKLLTLKLTALLALVSASRAQTLAALDLRHMQVASDSVTFQIVETLKTSKPNKPLHEVTLQKYCKSELCVLRTLFEYIRRTKERRQSQRLLVSFKTFKQVSTSTLARWLKTVLVSAGINTSVFKAHSYCGAATSTAFHGGVSLQQILKTADWKSAGTFHKFYYRQVTDPGKTFADQVLSRGTLDG